MIEFKEIRNRFKDSPWFPDSEKEDVNIIIGGAGGIGSWLALFLSRAGYIPVIYDFDVIEYHNMGGQFFREEDIGSLKVSALNKNIKEFSGIDITTISQKFDENSMGHKYMFSAFDNMKARKAMFDRWKEVVKSLPEDEKKDAIFIDGRLLAEQLQIFCVTSDKIKEYEKHLFSDDEVESVMCTFKQTSHVAAMIASLMTGFFTNHKTNQKLEDSIRKVPFYYEYFMPLNYSNTQENGDFKEQ